MRVTSLRLRNWRNFKSVDLQLPNRLFVLGPNASGKSNLLDALRFLRDLTVDGGGFQQAIRDRGGLGHVRNLNAKNNNFARVTLGVSIGDDAEPEQWRYELTFTTPPKAKRPLVHEEIVHRGGRQDPASDGR